MNDTQKEAQRRAKIILGKARKNEFEELLKSELDALEFAYGHDCES